ncbi:MAG: SDR family oxidoreductase [Chloroflexi bacterium]|nr:SDR family oxidoreductase [Chloroflexota bacterium]
MSKVIVITGSTKGIGYGLAEEFLKRGHKVVISGRKEEALVNATAALSKNYADKVVGQLCDVTNLEDCENLFAFAAEKFGQVDIWINNAGIAHPQHKLWEMPAEMVTQSVNANIIGTVYGAQVAIRGMLKQGHGWVYNTEGFGSNGKTRDGLSVYGATKSATTFLSKSLASELKDTPVKIGTLQPGMVITDMVVGQFNSPEELEKVKPIFNIIANRVSDVAPWLVQKMLSNQKSGAKLQFQSSLQLLLRFATAPFTKRNLFND